MRSQSISRGVMALRTQSKEWKTPYPVPAGTGTSLSSRRLFVRHEPDARALGSRRMASGRCNSSMSLGSSVLARGSNRLLEPR